MRKQIVDAVRGCLEETGLFRPDASLLAAVSGGGDSMALLYSLALLREEMPFQLTVCHVQHGLRGIHSFRDQQLVLQMCQQLNLPCVVEEAGLTGDMHTPGMETMARDARRAIFRRRMDTLPADALLTAHHQDDQTETLMMHFLRGTGLKGLCGMRKVAPMGNGLLLRPLLDFSKKTLLCWLHQEGIPFCHDESNDEPLTLRNALRLEALPLLETLSPGAAGRMAASAQSLQQDEDCLCAMANDLYHRCLWQYDGFLALKIAPLREAYPALALRALRQLYRSGLALAGLQPRESELSRENTLRALALLHATPGEGMNLPEDLCLVRGNRVLWLLRQGEKPLTPCTPTAPLCLKDITGGFRYGWLDLSIMPAGEHWQPSAMGVLLTQEEKNRFVLRFAAPNDFIHPMGAAGSKPLRRFMTDRHIDRPLRSHLPLLASEDEALWLPGLCCAERLRRESSRGMWLLTVTNAAEDCIHINKE